MSKLLRERFIFETEKKNQESRLASLPTLGPLQLIQVFIAGPRLYIIGGNLVSHDCCDNVIRIFDMYTRSWSIVTDFHIDLSNIIPESLKSKIKPSSSEIYQNLFDNQGSACCNYDGSPLITGGHNRFMGYKREVSLYNLNSGYVDKYYPMTVRRRHHTLTYMNETVFAIGGEDLAGGVPHEFFRESNTQKTWSTFCDSIYDHCGHTTFSLPHRAAIFVTGGIKSRNRDDNQTSIKLCESYDIFEDRWIIFDSLIEEKSGTTGGVINDILYLCGGKTDKGILCDRLDTLDMRQPGGWNRSSAVMIEGRYNAQSFIYNDKLVVFTGQGKDNQYPKNFTTYCPVANKWYISEDYMLKEAVDNSTSVFIE